MKCKGYILQACLAFERLWKIFNKFQRYLPKMNRITWFLSKDHTTILKLRRFTSHECNKGIEGLNFLKGAMLILQSSLVNMGKNLSSLVGRGDFNFLSWNVSASSHMTPVNQRNTLDPMGVVGDCSFTPHNNHLNGWILLQCKNMYLFILYFYIVRKIQPIRWLLWG